MMSVKNLLHTIAVAGLLVACNDYDPGLADTVMDNTDEELATMTAYTRNFVNRYGTINEDQTWGFGELADLKTRASLPNANQWEEWGYIIPSAISNAERKAVVKAFRTHLESNTTPDYADFFLQKVYEGGKDYASIGALSTGETISYETYLYADGYGSRTSSADKIRNITCVKPDGTTDYVESFRSEANDNMLMLGSSASAFRFLNTMHGNKMYDYHIILNVMWNEGGEFKSGTYVGFDFGAYGDNPNEQLARDYKYDDYIVKIIPAQHKDSSDGDAGTADPEKPVPPSSDQRVTETKRVMCEDLGNTYDFDFNDIVFDVYYTYEEANGVKNNITAHITVQAAGGTLPVYIGKVDAEHEAHYLLKKTGSIRTPLNVGDVKTAPRTFKLENCQSIDPNDINIYVNMTLAQNQVTLLPKSGTNNGMAPQKICVPLETKWLKESQQIEWGYPQFATWVYNPDFFCWEVHQGNFHYFFHF